MPLLPWVGLALCLPILASGSRAQQGRMLASLMSARACDGPPCCESSSVCLGVVVWWT